MPKRAAVTAALTAVAVALLINFKTPSQQGLVSFGAHRVVAVGQPIAQPSTGLSPTPTPQPTLSTVTFTGPAIDYYFGTAQVQVTLVNGRITDVVALQLPSEGQSGWISQQVEPMLRSEVLTAQSAQINLISGATYTSDAYQRSLQAALDQARA